MKVWGRRRRWRPIRPALEIEPDRAEGYANVGSLLRGMNMQTGAIQAFEHAIKLKPDLAIAHYDLAITFKQRDQLERGTCRVLQVCRVCARLYRQRFELVNLRRILCDWDGTDEEESHCLAEFPTKPATIAPFQLVAMRSSRADQLEAARRFVKTFAVPRLYAV